MKTNVVSQAQGHIDSGERAIGRRRVMLAERIKDKAEAALRTLSTRSIVSENGCTDSRYEGFVEESNQIVVRTKKFPALKTF
jgi:hypothetical protein